MPAKKIKCNKNLEIAKKMPPLFHTMPGKEFDIRKSEVVNWLVRQPEIMLIVMDMVKQSGCIEYDKESGMWTGIDYDN